MDFGICFFEKILRLFLHKKGKNLILIQKMELRIIICIEIIKSIKYSKLLSKILEEKTKCRKDENDKVYWINIRLKKIILLLAYVNYHSLKQSNLFIKIP